MEYRIVLSPELDMNPLDFVKAWNEDTVARSKAEAEFSANTSRSFDPALSALIDGSITLVGVLASGIATNALYDLIKGVVVKKSGKHIKIMDVDRPDGTHIHVVVIDEE